MQGQFAKLHAQVEALNAQLAKMGHSAQGVNPAGFQQMNKAIAQNSNVYRAAAASTGLWETEQLRVTSATENYTRALEKQKISFKDWARNQKVARAAYREQLAMQNMVVREMPGQRGGKSTLDIAVPTHVSKDLDTIGNRIGWIREQTRSASTQMINWGKNTQWAGRQLMVGFTLPMAAFGTAAGVMAYKVDQEMTRIRKVYDTAADQSSTNTKEMARANMEFAELNAASFNTAKQAARDYGVTMEETLGVQAELAATGQRGTELQSATTEVVKNAMLGEIDYQTATKATIAMQQTLHMSTSQLADTWAYMNSVENSTSLQMKDFATAIPIALGPIKQMGGGVKELGLLLTAMASRGIQAGKAANAIKAAMQRLIRPSKQIQEEFKNITGGDILKIGNDNKGNLIGMLQDIRKEMEGLDQQGKNKILAGLFGSYQVGNFTAMLDGLGDLDQGIGQVTAAYKVGEQAPKDWRRVQDQEIGQMQESISGKFKRAVATIQASLAETGKPFLEIATVAITGVTKIIDAFNMLPGGVKKTALLAAGFMALVGPMVMLTGLAANFAGNILKGFVAVTRFAGSMQILNKESAAARLASNLAEKGYLSETSAIQLQTAALEKLALATVAAHRATANNAFSGMGGYQGKYQVQSNVGTPVLNNMVANPMGNPQSVVKGTAAAAQDSDKVKRNWGGVASNIALAAGSLAVMGVAGDGVVNDIAKIAFSASLIAPAILPAVSALKQLNILAAITSGITKVTTGLSAAAAVAGGFRLRMILAAGVTGKVGVAARAVSGSLMAMLGPVGLVIAGLTAAGAAMYLLWKHAHKGRDEIKAMYEDAKGLSEIIGYSASEPLARTFDKAGNSMVTLEDKAEQFREKYKSVVNAIQSAKTNQDKFNIALAQGQKVINTGGSAEQAKEAVRIALKAANVEFNRSDKRQLTFKARLDFTDAENQIKNMAASAQKNIENSQIVKVSFFRGEPTISGDDQATNNAAAAQAGTEMARAYKIAVSTELGTTDWLKTIDSQLAAYDKAIANTGPGLKQTALLEAKQNYIQSLVKGRVKDEKDYAKSVLNSNSAAEILSGTNMQMTQATDKRSKAERDYEKLIRMNQKPARELTNEQKLQLLNQARAANGLKETGRLTDWTGKATQKWAGGTNDVKKGVDGVNRSLDASIAKAGQLTKEQKGTLVKNAMTDYQQNIADATTRRMDAQADAAIAATQAAGERRMAVFNAQQENATRAMEARQEAATDALSRRQEAATNALENRQENEQNSLEARQERRRKAIEASYDKRINAIKSQITAEQKADTIRKRIFDAEMTRIDRMNEASNRNIDFNVALNSGDLDEAARIRNDAESKAEGYALEDAQADADRKSTNKQDRWQNEIDKLEKSKDKALERIGKIEKAETDSLQRRQEKQKKFLQRRQELETRALKKRQETESRYMQNMQERRQKALQREVDNNNTAETTKWQRRKEALADSLKDFMGYVAKNNKDLKAHIKRWQKAHRDMTIVTEGQFDTSSRRVEQYLVKHIQEARRNMQNDNQWQSAGYKIGNKMIRGAFGLNWNQFEKWMSTGIMPKGGQRKPKKDKNVTTNPKSGNPTIVGRHEGGVIDASGGSRKGVARTVKGLHPNEQMVRAQKGEYMVNKKSATDFRPLLDVINSGKMPHGRGQEPDGEAMGGASGSRNSGMAGLMYGLAGAMMKSAIRTSIFRGAEMAKKIEADRNAASGSGMFTAAGAGKYGDTTFSAEQLKNAATIATTGKNLGASNRDIKIALMTAMQESTLRNLSGGDRDSVGLFQQRDPWGTFAQRTNPAESARMFFQGGHGGQRGLFDFPGRTSMSLAQAAQSVQVSAYPSAYAKWENEAAAIIKAMSYQGVSAIGGGNKYNLPGVKPWVKEAAEYLGGKYDIGTIYGIGSRSTPGSDHPKGLALDYMTNNKSIGDRLASDVIAHRDLLDAKYVIWRQRIASDRDGWRWRPMADRGSATANHMDHVHVSFDSTGDIDGLIKGTAPADGGFAQGNGGKHKPIKGYTWNRNGRGIHDAYTGFPALDVSAPIGTPIYAAHDGRVVRSEDKTTSYGRWVQIDGPGNTASLYAHMSRRLIGNGAEVRGGAKIGLVGSTGNSTGPHLHFGAHNPGPMTYLKTGGYTTSDGRAMLHANEAVISSERTSALYDGLDTFSGYMDNLKRSSVKRQYKKAAAVQGAANAASGESPSAKNTGKGFKLRTGTYNLEKDQSAPRNKEDLARLMPKADVLALTEFEVNARHGGVRGWLAKRGWGLHAAEGHGNGGGDYADTAVAWNQAKLKYLKGGTINTNPIVHGDKGARSRFAAYAQLQDIKSGTKFWQVAAHFVNHASPNYPKILANQMLNTYALYKRLKKSAPTFVGGDFNAPRKGYNGGKGTDKGFPTLYSNWEKMTGYKRGTSGHGSFIDQMLTDRSNKFAGGSVYRGLNSDHDALLTQYNIPGMKTGGYTMSDGLAMLHKKETILTEPLSKQLHEGMNKFANGGNTEYNINLYVTQPGASAEQILTKVRSGLRRDNHRKARND